MPSGDGKVKPWARVAVARRLGLAPTPDMVGSPARPERFPSLVAELLGEKELVPAAPSVGVVWSRADVLIWRAAEAAAREQKWKTTSLEIQEVSDLEAALKGAAVAKTGAIVVFAAAKTLGLTIPPSMVLRAEEVI